MLLVLACLVASATALPAVPVASVLSEYPIVVLDDPSLHTNVRAAPEAFYENKDDEKHDDHEKHQVLLLSDIPEAPVLEPLDPNFVKSLSEVEIKEGVQDAGQENQHSEEHGGHTLNFEEASKLEESPPQSEGTKPEEEKRPVITLEIEKPSFLPAWIPWSSNIPLSSLSLPSLSSFSLSNWNLPSFSDIFGRRQRVLVPLRVLPYGYERTLHYY